MSDFKYECNLHNWASWTKPCIDCVDIHMSTDNLMIQSVFSNDIVVSDCAHLDPIIVYREKKDEDVVELEPMLVDINKEVTLDDVINSINTIIGEPSLARVDELERLHNNLRKAEQVISFYASKDNWRDFKGHFSRYNSKATKITSDDIDIVNKDYCIGGLRARQYLKQNGVLND